MFTPKASKDQNQGVFPQETEVTSRGRIVLFKFPDFLEFSFEKMDFKEKISHIMIIILEQGVGVKTPKDV